ncbi:MAG: glycosyl hydrolase [bacterium]
MKQIVWILCAGVCWSLTGGASTLEEQFKTLPMEAKRYTGPLFWLHGDESPERLNTILDKVAESGNGTFTAESRPHKDWLGEGWYRDLSVCLDAAKRLDMTMWLFDEDWWPSQTIAGKVPAEYAAKKLVGKGEKVTPGSVYKGTSPTNSNLIAVVAGRLDASGAVIAESLKDLTRQAKKGAFQWTAPESSEPWQVMTFTWETAPRLKQGHRLAVDGMSPACVDWYIKTVYEPHHARFGKDFGKTIPGYFYDEPETPGDWGTALNETFKKRGIDWLPCYVAWKFKLAGEAQSAAFYQYAEARAETWGRVMFGGITKWCEARGVQSIGHFMEHGHLYLNPDYCAGDMMLLQKYSAMGGIDAVFAQFVMGTREARRDSACWQTPKLASSISHVYGKKDDLAMCEIFGARGQNLTYPEMKWWADHVQVSGINFLIPHSFNPRAPFDTDCPPYFYNGGFEPRYPLFRVWADYSSRLTLMLTGGRHICPVAVLFSGNTKQVGAYTPPDDFTTVLQDALYDCDWLPFELLEKAEVRSQKSGVNGTRRTMLKNEQESYRVVVVPAAEAITFDALEKVKAFYETGGVVIGYGRLPSRSLTMGKTDAEVMALRKTVWGVEVKTGTTVCATNKKSGRAYFMAEKPTRQEVATVLMDAGVEPVVRVVQGETDGWVHALRRMDREGREVIFVTNQNTNDAARTLTMRIPEVKGTPQVMDALRNELTTVAARQDGDGVTFDLTLEANESVLLRFGGDGKCPARLTAETKPSATLPVEKDINAVSVVYPVPPEKSQRSPCKDPVAFQGIVTVPASHIKTGMRAYLVCELPAEAMEPAAAIRVNGAYAGGFIGKPWRVEISKSLKAGENKIRIEPFPVKRVQLDFYP